MRRHAPFEPIDSNTCMWGGVPDSINYANFLKINPRVSVLTDPEIWHFPLILLVVLTTLSHYRVSVWSLGTLCRSSKAVCVCVCVCDVLGVGWCWCWWWRQLFSVVRSWLMLMLMMKTLVLCVVRSWLMLMLMMKTLVLCVVRSWLMLMLMLMMKTIVLCCSATTAGICCCVCTTSSVTGLSTSTLMLRERSSPTQQNTNRILWRRLMHSVWRHRVSLFVS